MYLVHLHGIILCSIIYTLCTVIEYVYVIFPNVRDSVFNASSIYVFCKANSM